MRSRARNKCWHHIASRSGRLSAESRLPAKRARAESDKSNRGRALVPAARLLVGSDGVLQRPLENILLREANLISSPCVLIKHPLDPVRLRPVQFSSQDRDAKARGMGQSRKRGEAT